MDIWFFAPYLQMAAAQLGAAAVSVRASSHVGGHKYAGVLVLFTSKGEGFWYGYASPSDASQILESHINNSKVRARSRNPSDEEQRLQLMVLRDMNDQIRIRTTTDVTRTPNLQLPSLFVCSIVCREVC